LIEYDASVAVGKVRREGDEESEDCFAGTGESWRLPSSNDLSKKRGEGGKDVGSTGELTWFFFFGLLLVRLCGRYRELCQRLQEMEGEGTMSLPGSAARELAFASSALPARPSGAVEREV